MILPFKIAFSKIKICTSDLYVNDFVSCKSSFSPYYFLIHQQPSLQARNVKEGLGNLSAYWNWRLYPSNFLLAFLKPHYGMKTGWEWISNMWRNLMIGFQGGASGKELTYQCRRHETWVRSLGREDPLEEGLATHSSILAWRIPRTKEPGGFIGLQRIGHDWDDLADTHMQWSSK